MDGRTDGRMDGWTDGWTDGRIDQSVLQEQVEYPSAKYSTFPILEMEKEKCTSYLKTGK